jgi:hypothetical protein
VSTLPSSSLARYAGWLGIAVGVGLFGHGIHTFTFDAPPPLPYRIAVLIAGALEVVLAWMTLRANRVGWSFFVSLNGTLFVVGLFGGPRVRDAFEIDLAFALLPCFLFATACTLAAVAHEDFGAGD